jgi:ComF family protein
MLESLIESAFQLFFPDRCAGCDGDCEEGASFCRICDISVLPVEAACARCALPLSKKVARCLACMARAPAFTAAWAPFEYGGAVAGALRQLKYAGRPEIARLLARSMPPALLAEAFAGAELVVPVPLHVRRLRERQFNQASVLALAMRARLPRPPGGVHKPRFSARALLKVRHTAPQSSLSFSERLANVRDAFAADPRRVAGRRLLLVDDVMTTGSTAHACARALLDAGATSVGVLTVARAVP